MARAGDKKKPFQRVSATAPTERREPAGPATVPDPSSDAPFDSESTPPSNDGKGAREAGRTKPRVRLGDVIARRYEVTGTLGEGGMGIVYRCRDKITRDQVALKRVILPEGRLANDYITWFYKEARALATLDHPNIVRARDFGLLADGSPFLAMDLVSGLSLHEYGNTRLSYPVIWSLVDQILGALAHAHSRGVVHGDLKPSNVIIEDGDGAPPMVHILDFGLAWLKQDPHDERLDGEKAMEFTPHAGAGTPGYMAPEQIMHEMHHVCGATDLYAIACILYKLIGGKAPFTGDPKELLKLHAYEDIPPLKPVFEVPEGLVDFVARCLRKEPWRRYDFAAQGRRAWGLLAPKVVPAAKWRLPRVAASERLAAQETSVSTDRTDGETSIRPPRELTSGLLAIRPSPLVGRQEVRERLLSICNDVIEKRGNPHRFVILVGPAGVGKSRLAEWLVATMHEQGDMVPLTARYRRMRSSSDGMVGAVIQHYNFERANRDTVETSLMARWGIRADDHAGKTWVAGAGEWLRPNPPESETLGPTGVRFTLDTLDVRRQVVRHTLRRIGGGRPLLFFLDDLHNASQTTLEGLLRIHQTELDQPLVMVATVRAEDVQLGTSTAERLRRLREALDGEVIEVNPMDRDATMELLQASLPLDAEAMAEAARRSRGFPLFALQQLHAWAHAGELRFEEGAYHVPAEVLAVRPKTTAELWETRLKSLSTAHREMAYAVATLGIDVRQVVLTALLQGLGAKPDEVILALQRAEILLPRGPGRYSWPHALLQEHLFRRLSERKDAQRLFVAASDALKSHPLASTRRVVRQRVVNLLYARQPDTAAEIFFDFLKHSWNGARQPAATLVDLDLFKGQLTGAGAALAQRWRAEALRHVGRTEEATHHAEQAMRLLEIRGDELEVAHCQRLLGHLKSEQGDSITGRQLVDRALATFEKHGSTAGMAQCDLVIGQIEMLAGRYAEARDFAERGEANFAKLDQPLGRGQCLLLSSSVEHSEGATNRARLLTERAQTEFERCGYRLGQAQTTASLAHLEHRLSNFYNAERHAQEALSLFESLKTLRGQSACERLLGMIAIDTDNLDEGDVHALRAEKLYSQMRDPWGVVEARLLRAQSALSRRDQAEARRALMQAREITVREPEPRQHYLLTRAWFQLLTGDPRSAEEAITAARTVFAHPFQVGDHTPHLLARLTRQQWPNPEALDAIEEWRSQIHDHARRDQT
jgi:serine/threonine protein kinase/tetratricopeptide (TPR) repeat protein